MQVCESVLDESRQVVPDLFCACNSVQQDMRESRGKNKSAGPFGKIVLGMSTWKPVVGWNLLSVCCESICCNSAGLRRYLKVCST